MTFREKLAKEHPDCINEIFMGGAKYCPFKYGYESQRDDCSGITCAECWDREIPDTEETKTFTKIADDIADVYHGLMDRGIPEGTATSMTRDLIDRGYFDK